VTGDVRVHAVISNARIATMDARVAGPYGTIDDGAIVTASDGTIVWTGRSDELPARYVAEADDDFDAGGRLVTPGLIDCHTHLVYAGNRVRDFELRLNGVHYADIARAGGGILSTVRATRAAAGTALVEESETRLRALANGGVTTVEIKSGYGLDRETELEMLRAARDLGARCGVDVHVTYLGLHARPPEFDDAGAYVDFVIDEMLPAIAAERLADAVDAFCETIAFTPAQTARYFEAAHALGFHVKLHADQLSDGGGAALAARYGALSADHLEHASAAGLTALAAAGTVAVLLPGATYFLREKKLPPIAEMRRLGIPIAVATDCNPGTSPLVSLPLALNMACTLLGLTPEEALTGATRNAARALGIAASTGTVTPGKRADLVVWDAAEPAEIAYGLGTNLVHSIVRHGRTKGARSLTSALGGTS
jgi:imidazolonepropionase